MVVRLLIPFEPNQVNVPDLNYSFFFVTFKIRNFLVPPKIRSELVSDNTSKSDPTYEIRHVSEAEDLVIYCPIVGNPELSFVWYQLRLDDLSGDEVERILQPENTSEKVYQFVLASCQRAIE